MISPQILVPPVMTPLSRSGAPAVAPRVPFLDLGAAHAELRDELDAALLRVAHGGRYLLGPELEAFEAEFAAYCGARHCVAVGSGLDALELGLVALGVGPGDEVVVPANTFVATWLAVSRAGALPVPVEPDPNTGNLDVSRLEAAITPRTRCILPVHLYGQPCDMEGVLAVARRHGLPVLDDAAQAHGALHRGRRVGTLADCTAWSFYPGKNLGAMGDGGAVTSDDDALADAVRLRRNYGSRPKYANEVRGTNSRLDELQAAVLRVKLRRLDDWNARRAAHASRYRRELAGCEDLTLPTVAAFAEPVWHLFVVRTPHRDALLAHLDARGVDAMVHYPIPPHRQRAYADLGLDEGALPVTERLHREVLSLPMGPHLDDQQAAAVIAAVREFRP
jgi:dTDP-3-amino-3,4,6-trideoxy-alpha-D-glucose transaminase